MHKRNLTNAVREALEDTPVNVIVGARQVGKSTICRELISEGVFGGAMVTLDDPTALRAAKADPLGFLQDLGDHIIIDEVQREPDLFLSIKKLVDEDRKGRRIILTGSADVMTMPKVADSLAGRTEIHQLWPLSQDEIWGLKSGFLETLVSDQSDFTTSPIQWNDLARIISTGGYPEAVDRTSERRRNKWFESYIYSILQKDIRELSNIEGLSQIPNVLELIATRVGSTINFSDIGRLAGIKSSTLHRYVTLLEQIFLIHKIPAWTANTEGQFVKSPKVILNDTGLLCYLMGENTQTIMKNRTRAGSFFENFVVLEILKQISWFDDLLKPFHFSIHQGAEVDLVLEDRRKQLYGIEIKVTASVQPSDFKGLKKLAEIAGDRFQRGIVLYTGDQVIGGFGGRNLQAVPIGALWAPA